MGYRLLFFLTVFSSVEIEGEDEPYSSAFSEYVSDLTKNLKFSLDKGVISLHMYLVPTYLPFMS